MRAPKKELGDTEGVVLMEGVMEALSDRVLVSEVRGVGRTETVPEEVMEPEGETEGETDPEPVGVELTVPEPEVVAVADGVPEREAVAVGEGVWESELPVVDVDVTVAKAELDVVTVLV
jgi:hypothetical protein